MKAYVERYDLRANGGFCLQTPNPTNIWHLRLFQIDQNFPALVYLRLADRQYVERRGFCGCGNVAGSAFSQQADDEFKSRSTKDSQ